MNLSSIVMQSPVQRMLLLQPVSSRMGNRFLQVLAGNGDDAKNSLPEVKRRCKLIRL